MYETYATRDPSDSRLGGLLLGIISVLAGVLVIAGLYYAAGTGERHKVALAAAGCEPNLSPDPASVPCTTVWELERSYTKITTSAIQQLNADAADYAANDTSNLAASEAALTAEVASARAFEKNLAQFPWPPVVAPPAKALMQAISGRVKLIAEQARSSSLAQLQSFNAQIEAGSTAIETDMNLLHTALYTRPTVNQEP